MSSVPASLRELFETAPLVHVTTIDPDGTPHITLAAVRRQQSAEGL